MYTLIYNINVQCNSGFSTLIRVVPNGEIMTAQKHLILPLTTVTICIHQTHIIVCTRSFNFSRVIFKTSNFKNRKNAYYNRINKWVL